MKVVEDWKERIEELVKESEAMWYLDETGLHYKGISQKFLKIPDAMEVEEIRGTCHGPVLLQQGWRKDNPSSDRENCQILIH